MEQLKKGLDAFLMQVEKTAEKETSVLYTPAVSFKLFLSSLEGFRAFSDWT